MEESSVKYFGKNKKYVELREEICEILDKTNNAFGFLESVFSPDKDLEFTKEEVQGYAALVQRLWDSANSQINTLFDHFDLEEEEAEE